MRLKIVLILFLVGLSLFSCKSKKQEHEHPPVGVTSFVLKPQNIPIVLDFMGFARSPHPVEIRARVEGYLDKIAYTEGSIVQEGQLLFQIDPRPFQAAVDEAQGEVARQEALLQNAKLIVNRLTPLYRENAASQKDLDNAIANELATNAALISAKAQLLKAQINLGYTTITSPITGSADKARYREGSLINPSANTLMTTVSVLNPIWVYFNVSDNDIIRLKEGSEEKNIKLPTQSNYVVEVLLSDMTPFSQKGKVDFASPTYDESTGSLQVRAVFPNPDHTLLPGQFVRIRVYGAERPEALFVPQRALVQKTNGVFVYLIDSANKVSLQEISTGEWYGDYEVVTNGLKEGDRIVVDGITKIVPGSNVEVIGEWVPPKDKSTK